MSLLRCTGLFFALLRYEKMFLEWIFILDAVPPTSGLRWTRSLTAVAKDATNNEVVTLAPVG